MWAELAGLNAFAASCPESVRCKRQTWHLLACSRNLRRSRPKQPEAVRLGGAVVSESLVGQDVKPASKALGQINAPAQHWRGAAAGRIWRVSALGLLEVAHRPSQREAEHA